MAADGVAATQPVKRALQDVSRRMLVDDRGALLAADIGGNEITLDRGGGKPLVPQRDRQRGQPREIAREGAGRLRARALAAVHVDGQAEHETGSVAFGGKRQQAAASAVKFFRATVSTPVASRRSGSLVATPIVLVPRSSPMSAPRAGNNGAMSMSGSTGMKDA